MLPKAAPIVIEKGLRISDAFHHTMEVCLRNAAANLVLIGTGQADTTHQARVSLRRARSALALFKPVLHEDERKALNKEFRQAGRWLAASRDWDVFIHETLPKLQKHGDGLDQLPQLACERRNRAYISLREQQPALTEMILGAEIEFVEQSNQPIEVIAPDLLDRLYFRVRHRCRHVETEEERHRLRKAMKRLRYSVEFLSGLYDAKMVKQFTDHCKQAQEVLGKMNDACTMIRLLNELEIAYPTLVEWGHQQQQKAESRLAKAITDFRSAKLFWD